MSVKLLTEQNLEFLSLKGVCTGSSESTLVKMPHCWKSHVVARLKSEKHERKYSAKTSNDCVLCPLNQLSVWFSKLNIIDMQLKDWKTEQNRIERIDRPG